MAVALAVGVMPLAPSVARAQSTPAPLPNQLPALGDSVSGEFGVGTERQLGDRIMAEIRRDPAYFSDPLLDDYLESLWQQLLAAARARGAVLRCVRA